MFNEWYAKDTSKKIKAVFRAKGMSGERISTNIPYGYLQDENKHLIVDEETAPVVRMIYQLCAEGNGPGKIARILREREIKTPRTMDFLRTGRTDGYDPDDPCGWASTTVASILSHKEYLGHTVNFKTTKKSYKSKRFIKNPEEKQVVFENTHEAIIDTELWDVVQKIREQRHRPTLTGETALFSGLLFCADCGSVLTLHRPSSTSKEHRSYMCSRYRNSRGVQTCNAHYIREDVINSLVLENLKKVIAYAKDYESEFVEQVSNNISAAQVKQQSILKGKLEQQTRRITEIDAIIQRLYEDLVKGTLTDERFAKMSGLYEKEQKELEVNTAELKKTVEACEQQLAPFYNFVGQIEMSMEKAKIFRRTAAQMAEYRHTLSQQV